MHVTFKCFFCILFLGFYNFYKYTNYIIDSTCTNIYYTTLMHEENTLHYTTRIKERKTKKQKREASRTDINNK